MRALVLAALVCLLPHMAAADEDRAGDLFDDGMQLMAKKAYAKACPAFEQSFEVDPSLRTQAQLALCYEKWGKWVLAYKAYRKAAAMARDANDDRFSKLRTQGEKAGRKIARITVRIPSELDARATFTVDGVPIERDGLAEDVVLEPGSHTIAAKLPGRAAVSETLELEAGAREPLQLQMSGKQAKWSRQDATEPKPAKQPELKPEPQQQPEPAKPAKPEQLSKTETKEAAPEAKTDAAPEPDKATPTVDMTSEPKTAKPKHGPATSHATATEAPTRKRGRLFGGIALTLIGAGAIGGSSYIALDARSDYKAVEAMCPGGKCATEEAFTTTRDAKAKARTMTYVFGGGVALAALGVYLIATSRAEPADRPVATLFFSDGGGGIAIGGSL
jgi:hypothetical protein